jgi:sulfopyruvate decarboxylase subunit alpha
MVWWPFAPKPERADTLEVTDLHSGAPPLYSTHLRRIATDIVFLSETFSIKGWHRVGGDMKREVAVEIIDSLKEAGVDFVATLTEANLHDLVMALGEDKAIHHVPVTREEEGIGICAGAYLGGRKPAMVMMNAGFLLSANALATVCIHPGIPVLMLIGHSGGAGEENAGHATVGALTEPVLQAMHIMYEKVGRFEEIRPAIRDSQILARSSRRPTAIVLNKQALR